MVKGFFAFYRELQGVAIAGERDVLAAQTLQHPDEEPGVDNDGVLAVADAGQADTDRDLQIGSRKAQMPVAARLQENALEHLQRGNVRRDGRRLPGGVQKLQTICGNVHVFSS